MVFLFVSRKKLISKLRDQAFFYVWDESPEGHDDQFECRLMTSWDTTGDDIEKFLEICRGLHG